MNKPTITPNFYSLMDILTLSYDGNPYRIYFTNGNVTKYRYSAAGQKLSVEYYVAAPKVTVA